MLVLSRRVGEKVRIGPSVVVTVLKVHRDRTRLGIEAPRHIPVHRQEVFDFLKGGPSAAQRRPGVSRRKHDFAGSGSLG